MMTINKKCLSLPVTNYGHDFGNPDYPDENCMDSLASFVCLFVCVF